jgi:leucyl/phenylalanyl-tRNA--protein transferase
MVFWMSWWFLKHAKHTEQEYFHGYFQSNFRGDFKLPRTSSGMDKMGHGLQMIEAYCKLNELGIAKSIEVWQNEELVGGLYGIDLGRIFLWRKYVF